MMKTKTRVWPELPKIVHGPVTDRKERIGSTLHGNAQDYRITEHLATGGQADIYRCTGISTTRIETQYFYAAKWYHNSADARQERLILSQVEHPNIVSLLDYASVQKGEEINIFEWSISSLSDDLASRHRFTTLEITRILSDISSALDYLHSIDIIHCDVKPGNILVSNLHDRYILSDFGCAQQVDGDSVDALMRIPGTLPYRSPEQHRHEQLTRATDQYSFALVVAELLKGYSFFASRFQTNGDGINYEHLQQAFDQTPFEAVFRKALNINPSERFDSLEDFVSEILPILERTGFSNKSDSFDAVEGADNIPKVSGLDTDEPSRIDQYLNQPTQPYRKITELVSIYAAIPDELSNYRAKLLEQIDEYSERTVLLLLYKSRLQQECLDRLQKARVNLMELPSLQIDPSGVEDFRRRLLDNMYELRLIHVIITREQKSQDGEKMWRWIVPILILSYIVAIVVSITLGQRYYTSQMEIPLLGVPVSVIIWASLGSLGAILYRFYTRQPGRLVDEVRWLVARPIIGIIMGALGYLTVLSGIFAFGGASAADAASNSRPQLMWLVAFLGGFSDRFFESVIDGVIGRFSNDSK